MMSLNMAQCPWGGGGGEGGGQDCPDGKAPGARPQRRQVHVRSGTCVSMCMPSLLGTCHVKKDRWEKGPQTSLAWPLLFR